MGWRKAFPNHDVPAAVERLVRGGEASDASWRFGTMPRFVSTPEGTEVSLWVDHPDPNARPIAGPRFFVDEGGGDPIRYKGDDVRAAIAAFRRAVKATAKPPSKADPWDRPPPKVDRWDEPPDDPESWRYDPRPPPSGAADRARRALKGGRR